MELIKLIFDIAKVVKLDSRADNRGLMTVAAAEEALGDIGIPFNEKETRAYVMNKAGTFFGIHYREVSDPMAKLVTVIQGRGMDYLIDLREDSPTYLQWEQFELTAENALAVYVPAGIGHAFISMEENTIQLFTIDKCGKEGLSKQLNYKEPRIGLKLPIEVTEISTYDAGAAFLK